MVKIDVSGCNCTKPGVIHLDPNPKIWIRLTVDGKKRRQRLCLVDVKRFSENTYFSKMLIFEKGKCLHGVWLHFKKFSGKYFPMFGKEERKHKSRKTQATTQKKIINDDTEHRPTTAPSIAIRDRDRRRDRDLAFFARSQSMAISIRFDLVKARSRSRSSAIAISIRSRDRDQRRLECLPTRSRSVRTGDRDRARALSLSLSLIFRKYFEGKIEV